MHAKKAFRHGFLRAVLAAAIVGLLVAIAVPNFPRRDKSKLNAILSHLRQIDAAKAEWALEHGLTNSPLPSRVVTERDLAPFLLPAFTNGKEFGAPMFGELYLIRDLNEPVDVVLTRDLSEYGRPLPRGTVVRLDPMPESAGYELIAPDGTSTIDRWVRGNFTILHR